MVLQSDSLEKYQNIVALYSQIQSKLVLGPLWDPNAWSCNCAVYLDVTKETDIKQSANCVRQSV